MPHEDAEPTERTEQEERAAQKERAGQQGGGEPGHTGHALEPWWADLGTWGAVALIAFGALAAIWVFLRLPGTPDEPPTGYYGAAKVIAIGLVTVGCAVMGRRRSRTGAAHVEETGERAGQRAEGRAEQP
ncbi:hypothetical protein [Streptomyces sp. cg36]|uniref:hypothetical protein n=1 Tax=Streptomyces sp. cg36 TaxID=3238798 RepID=UPI0034E1EB74